MDPPGCPTQAQCAACGDLLWEVDGTIVKEIYGGGGALIQRQTWVLSSYGIVTRDSGGSVCRWLNNNATSGSNTDFISYSGTYILEPVGSTTLVSSFAFTEPSANDDWRTDSLCDAVTFVDVMTMSLERSGGSPTAYTATDQFGDPIDVTPPTLTFARNSNSDCPIGVFNAIDPSAGTTEYPTLPVLVSDFN